MKSLKLFTVVLLLIILTSTVSFKDKHDFRIRTITAGVTLSSISDTTSILKAIDFLKKSRQVFIDQGYEVQTVRISTQHLHELVSGKPTANTITHLKRIDKILVKNDVGLAMGELLSGNQYDPELATWTAQLVRETKNINFSIAISSAKYGIRNQSIKTAAEICRALAGVGRGGEANFRFTASANCPAGIPFFPAAFHQGVNSFAIGLEYPNVITRVFKTSNWESAEANLKKTLEAEMKPIEAIAARQETPQWKYDGIDTSPAPGLDASIGDAIEALTKKPFGSGTTLSACALITKVIKNLDVKSCGYSGLMLPVIEDKTLAKRATEHYYTIEELLLFSSVSGTGLDVVPIAGSTSAETMEGVYRDAAALSLKYFNKALSVRLFPIPGKKEDDLVTFENPYLTSSTVMKLN